MKKKKKKKWFICAWKSVIYEQICFDLSMIRIPVDGTKWYDTNNRISHKDCILHLNVILFVVIYSWHDFLRFFFLLLLSFKNFMCSNRYFFILLLCISSGWVSFWFYVIVGMCEKSDIKFNELSTVSNATAKI